MPYITIDPAEVTAVTNAKGPLVFVPRDEAYFWTDEWQAGEREAQQAIDSGDTVTFDSDNPGDIIRWLLSEDDQA